MNAGRLHHLGLAACVVGGLLLGCSLLLDVGTSPAGPCDPGCQAGELCLGERCLPQDCRVTDCAEGALCDDGRCVARACVGVSCPDGEACADGRCLPTSCAGVACAEGELCLDGACKDLRCQGLICPGGTVCLGAACEGCAATEAGCANGLDEDCDDATDCEDPDCAGDACSDGSLCTLGETCGAGTGGGASCAGGGPVGCEAPPSANGCWKPVGSCVEGTGCVYEPHPDGTACDDGNPCTTDACDGAGACVGTPRACASPPNAQCFEAMGQCNPANGQCVYTPKPPGTPCAGPNSCRTGDACNAAGSCVDGTQNVTDGTKCGSAPGERCCSGGCVDISKDEANCGGCGHPCAAGRECLSLTARPCSAPAGDISGRCACNANSAECKLNGFNQACRTGNEANVCVPAQCSPGQVVVIPNNDLAACAPYCRYP